MPLNRQMPANRTGFNNDLLRGFLVARAGAEGLGSLGTVAIDCNGLQAEPPTFNVGLLDFFHRRSRRQVNSFRNRARDERLHGAHHFEMAHVVNRS
jgi:hypothetical protein